MGISREFRRIHVDKIHDEVPVAAYNWHKLRHLTRKGEDRFDRSVAQHPIHGLLHLTAGKQ